MSGGVDSLTTALLLKQQGVDIWGIHMIVGVPPEKERHPDSFSLELEKTRKVLKKIEQSLEIEIKIVDLRDVFYKLIIKPFVNLYLQGFTPNPCIPCNAKIKFGMLLHKSLELGAKALATGHYARVKWDAVTERWQLLRGTDRGKEQSYFLYQLTQEQLKYAIFPLGEKFKREVYEYLEKKKLSGIISRESHEICFIPDNDYKGFIKKMAKIEDIPGEMIDKNGTVLGKHRGIFRYTIGQRRGIGIPSSEPYYVIGIDPKANRVEIGRKEDLYGRKLVASNLNWVSIAPPRGPLKASVQIRYRHRAAAATIELIEKNKALVEFEKPQKAITPGQFAVIYDDDLVLGGGQITEVIR